MLNFDVTENGVIRVRSRRFLAHLNGTGQKLNFGLFSFSLFSFIGFIQHFPYFSYLFPPKQITNRVPLILPLYYYLILVIPVSGTLT